jgi:lipopolysaccharide export system permease protein
LLVPYLIASVFLAIFSFYLGNFLIPKTNIKMMAFEKVYIKNPFRSYDRDIHMQISPGTFVYLESYNASSASGYKFSMEHFENDKLTMKLSSERISWDSISGRWKIKNYYIRKIDGMNESLIKGKELDTLINMNPREFTFILDDVKTLDYWELRAFIEKEKLKGSENIKEYEVEKHKRMAFPFATLILTIIGVSISSRKVRGGIGMHLGMGIAITFTFIFFQQVSTVFATRGNLDPALAVWLPNIIFGVLALYLLKIAPK